MKIKHKTQSGQQTYYEKHFLKDIELSDEAQEEIAEMCGVPAPSRSNEEWIHLLRQRLTRQKRQFLAMLDHAAENPELLKNCEQFRREIRAARQRLADCRMMRSSLN